MNLHDAFYCVKAHTIPIDRMDRSNAQPISIFIELLPTKCTYRI